MKNSESMFQSCIICEEEKKQGIFLYTSFICQECETGILQTETSDPIYHYYLDKLKMITLPQSFL